MNKRSSRTGLPIVYILAASLSASQVYADWSGDKLYQGYNQRYGDFPPVDIDERLSDATKEARKVPAVEASKTDNKASAGAPPAGIAAATNSNPAASSPAHTAQPLQQPAYGNYQYGYYAPPAWQGYNRRQNLYNPWNRRGSSFSGPWNNRRGSGFSAPWGNNGSGFRPWGNGGSWSW